MSPERLVRTLLAATATTGTTSVVMHGCRQAISRSPRLAQTARRLTESPIS
jgi:hypothetical protein